ncbi:MAG: S46 family peptidase [Bacteroidia bacterium]|nr:S46 family peptidase [Bacteroidia bacterium]
MLRHFSLLIAGMSLVAVQTLAQSRSYEGMWLPFKAKDLNYADMQSVGVALPADGVYNEAGPSLEDAVIRLNGGSCTAELISSQGLVLTNHHCAYDDVANLSTPENDLLTNGFWAANHGAELPIEGATAEFLIHSEDVTAQVLKDNPDEKTIEERIEALTKAATEGTAYEAEVVPMYAGNEYYLFVYEVYTDIRLVGVPPSAIGKYGYDQDNWVWPRHTGDFTLLRIYAGKDNKPADYAPDNVPFKPTRHLTISLAGVKENDYAMVMGYPGSTTRYLTSPAVNMALQGSNQVKIHLFGIKTSTMRSFMDQSDNVRLGLAGEYASLMNTYKYFIGQTTMLSRYDIAGKKAEEEKTFQAWADADPARKEKYGAILSDMKAIYGDYGSIDQFMNYLYFGALGPASTGFAFFNLNPIRGALASKDEANIAAATEKARGGMEEHFKAFYPEVDQAVFAALFKAFYNDMPAELRPEIFDELLYPERTVMVDDQGDKKGKKKKSKKQKGGEILVTDRSPEERIDAWTAQAYATSIVTDKARMEAFLAAPTREAIEADPIFKYIQGVIAFYRGKVALPYITTEGQIESLNKAYIQGLREMNPTKAYYPDANSTMRLTYGKVLPYQPRDGVAYNYFTTIEGIMEKYREKPKDPDYFVPEKLVSLYESKDYGRYADNGRLIVNFLTTNDITGGNSGSPVLNAKGELIGCAFDGNWEAMAGDIYVFPKLNRTICVDIGYVLFIIEKFGNAKHIVDEMTIVE